MRINESILIVGGAGYIGSHMTHYLSRLGFHPIVLDNLVTGHRDAVTSETFVLGDMADETVLSNIFSQYNIKAVMHFGGYIQVGESTRYPDKYYQNNVASTISLLNTMIKHRISYFIFSSSASVYGEPQYTPIDEKHVLAPINPYGRTKWMTEMMLSDYAKSFNVRYASLRYFNAAGVDTDSGLQERHDPETHLIPLILQAAKYGSAITVHGDDYPTKDGTCIRDYVHVKDLCHAHFLALKALWAGESAMTYNLGTGHGYSVQQVIDVASQVTGKKILVKKGPRRHGDPAVLVADPGRVMKELNWKPVYSDLLTIIKDVWEGMQIPYPLEKWIHPHPVPLPEKE